jgi:predicted O-linked N-acetylglucosamine transferase (SPINDLY family)
VTLKPDFAEAWAGRGNVFYDLKRYDDAAAAYDKALALKPVAEAWAGLGNVYASVGQHDDAMRAYDKALAINPDLKYVEGDRVQSKLLACDWAGLEADASRLIQAVREGKAASVPFSILSIASLPADQLRCAEIIVADKYAAMPPVWRGERYKHDRIRLAYLSGDFREHAMSYLASGMFECHDKSRFETTAISWGPDENSDIRKRIIKSFDRFVDVRALDDAKVAELVRDMEIDIAVDLMGFTRGLRAGIFARRPSPIQINYLGYVGTIGAPYIDYIIADRTVIPADQYEYFSEKVVCLPGSFQVNDRERRIADKVGARAEAALPEEGFVFCCFNNNYKITPDVFDIWMRILKRVDGSVLWLVETSPTMERNLRNEAAARGVNAERLVFAKPVKLPEHLARLRLADLFLDTLPYNAGATASDSLWAGVPVLTRIGVAMNGRMAASLLNAIGLPELIAATPEAYEQTAVELATQPEKMAIIKRKLAENRLTTPLFDTRLFTKHIEAAYTVMHERHQAGLAPDHLYIPK